MVEENQEDQYQPESKFNFALGNLQRIDAILKLIHEASFKAVEGDTNHYFFWRHWLNRFNREIIPLINDVQLKEINKLKSDINKALEDMDNRIKISDEEPTIDINTGKISFLLDELEDKLRLIFNKFVPFFPEQEDPNLAIKR